ncbi:MAG: polysaccharide deacetylase family protein [Lachnospiraceae bacterium]|nr:polysaccharide deacetylase family protein [Lachnospiraceae bacterium]
MKYLYPQGKKKALTFSYDDGEHFDRKLVDIFNNHGLKATFHLNSGNLGHSGPGNTYVDPEELVSLYKGHEVACHGVHHKNMPRIPLSVMTKELFEDRIALEKYTGKIIQGFSYPFGSYTPELISALKAVGIKYSRTVNATAGFFPPGDFYEWHPTCHHYDNLIELGKRFLEVPDYIELPLMYVWGHSFEFGRANDWTVIEEFTELVCGKEDIWYATNMEICDYLTAVKSLEYSADESIVHNPSAISVWIEKDGAIEEISPNETRRIL